MSYFHTGIRTIIGAEAFHCPVRDGKEWDHLAMVIRLNWLPPATPAGKPIRRVDRIRFLIASQRWHNRVTLTVIVKVIGSSLTSN